MPGSISAVEGAGNIVLILAPDHKGLQKIFGIPAARRLALMSRQLGFVNIHVIGQSDSLRPCLSDIVSPSHFHQINEPGAIASAVKEISPENESGILIFRANHVLDKPTLSWFLKKRNFSEVSFLETNGNNGKERIYLTSSRYLIPVLNEVWRSRSGNGVLGAAVAIPSPDGLPLGLDGTAGKKKLAEDALLHSLAHQTRKTDGFLARHVSRRISRPMSRRIAYSGITPNQVTFFGALIGLIGAFFFGWGGYWNQLVGSLLFLLCIIIDGVDGEIARLKLRESAAGHKLDIFMDNVVHVGIFTGIAVGLYRDSSQPAYLYFLALLLGGFMLCVIAVNRFLSNKSAGKLLKFMESLSNRDFAYLLVVLALFGVLQWFLMGAAVGAYVFAIVLWVMGGSQPSSERVIESEPAGRFSDDR